MTGLRALADHRRAAELREEHGERVLAGDFVPGCARAGRTTPGSAARRGRAASRAATAACADRGAAQRVRVRAERDSRVARSPRALAPAAVASAADDAVQEEALGVDLGQPVLDPGERGAEVGGLAGEVGALALEVGPLGGDGADEAG